ncbi:hypothetical protein V8E36_003816 [Tilletia maclaganii]
MSRKWQSGGRNDGLDADDWDGEGGSKELMDWDQVQHTSTKDVVLFCIDAGPHMHKINPDSGMSYLYSALYAASRFQEAKLISSPNDMVGIMLFGTAESDLQDCTARGPLYSHCTIIQPIDKVDVIPLTQMYDLLADDERGQYHLKDVKLCAPYQKPFRIDHALGNAVHYLMAQGKTGYKRIFFMTNNDDPTVQREDVTKPLATDKGKDKAKRQEAVRNCLRYVKEADTRNIELEPLLISDSQHAFDIERFYADIFATYDEPMSSDDEDEDDDGDESDESETDDEDADYDLLKDLNPSQSKPSSAKREAKAQKRAQRLQRQTKREQRAARYRSLYDCATKMEDLSKELTERQMPKRVTFNTTMTIGEQVHIDIKGYAMFAKAHRGTPVRMVELSDGAYGEVAAKVVPVCEDTGQMLKPKQDIETAFSFGAAAAAASIHSALLAERAAASRDEPGQDISEPADLGSVPGSFGRGLAKFSKEEVREMREMGVPRGIRILGFKPKKRLEFWMNTKHAVFLYPDDETWAGSKRFFASLLQSMAKKKVFAEALCLPRTGTTPYYAAIWPREEQISVEGVQQAAPGMFLIPLPFADDMRDNPYGTSMRAKATEVEAAKAIVKKYTANRDADGKDARFDPDLFENPALALHYATIRAVAFNRESPKTSKLEQARAEAAAAAARESHGRDKDMAIDGEQLGVVGMMLRQVRQAEQVADSTLPSYDAMKKMEDKEGLIRKFNQTIEKGGYGKVRGAPPKFKKKDEGGLRVKWRSGDLGTYKVDDLKAILAFYKEPTTGRKAELIERLDARLTLLFKNV